MCWALPQRNGQRKSLSRDEIGSREVGPQECEILRCSKGGARNLQLTGAEKTAKKIHVSLFFSLRHDIAMLSRMA
jgi:hypothetical protein